jgi:hypothetical protein
MEVYVDFFNFDVYIFLFSNDIGLELFSLPQHKTFILSENECKSCTSYFLNLKNIFFSTLYNDLTYYKHIALFEKYNKSSFFFNFIIIYV